MIHVELTSEAPAWGDEAPWQKLVEQCCADVMAHLGMADVDSELSVLLTDDAHIQNINAQWRSQDKPTNVLSFPPVQLSPGDRPTMMMGDIVLAHETIKTEAALAAKAFDVHFTHLVIHGLLHLLGYDHVLDNDAETMENLEKDILAAKGIADPYLPVAP